VAHVRFLALHRHGSLGSLDSFAESFRTAYGRTVPSYSDVRFNVYSAIAYLKLARIVACITRPPRWQEELQVLLSEARQCI
jgi:hypothetical protein